MESESIRYLLIDREQKPICYVSSHYLPRVGESINLECDDLSARKTEYGANPRKALDDGDYEVIKIIHGITTPKHNIGDATALSATAVVIDAKGKSLLGDGTSGLENRLN